MRPEHPSGDGSGVGGVTVHGGGWRGGRGAGGRALLARGHHGDAGEAGAGAAVQRPAVGAGGGPRLAAAGDDVPVLELPAALLGRQLELHEHHMVAHAQGQGERGASRQEVVDLSFSQAFQGLHHRLLWPGRLGHQAGLHGGHQRQLASFHDPQVLQLPGAEAALFVQQSQPLLRHLEALGQAPLQPLHRLLGGHGELIAGAGGGVDAQVHGGLAGEPLAGGSPAAAAPGAGLRVHPPTCGGSGARCRRRTKEGRGRSAETRGGSGSAPGARGPTGASRAGNRRRRGGGGRGDPPGSEIIKN